MWSNHSNTTIEVVQRSNSKGDRKNMFRWLLVAIAIGLLLIAANTTPVLILVIPNSKCDPIDVRILIFLGLLLVEDRFQASITNDFISK
jgi:hypothetical protein